MHLDITVNEFHLGRFSRQQALGNPHHLARLQLARVFDFVARLQLVPQAGRAKVALGQAFQRIARSHYVRRFVLLVCGPQAPGASDVIKTAPAASSAADKGIRRVGGVIDTRTPGTQGEQLPMRWLVSARP